MPVRFLKQEKIQLQIDFYNALIIKIRKLRRFERKRILRPLCGAG